MPRLAGALDETLQRLFVDRWDEVAKLLDAPGSEVSPEAQRRFSLTLHSSLLTPGVHVEGCLDACSICEPTLEREIELLETDQKHHWSPGGVTFERKPVTPN